ncbi:Ribosome-binding ATPase YchF [Candidatus Anstonella stagnisolia]|nr:Ribosome-binding ATPase YchF [Candidatus Anstonella stagnisolia]
MIIGIVGAPNKGKSTFFSAATMVDAQIADYPFTTIDPNKGVAYVRSPCPHVALGLKKCDARNSKCEGGVRLIPINMVDVAGLVPDAHLGKGMGNQFLGDLAQADVLIQVVDASGRTDVQGNRVEGADVCEEVRMLQREIEYWIKAVLDKNWAKIKGRGIADVALALSGMNVGAAACEAAARECGLQIEKIEWDDGEKMEFCKKIREASKPIVVAANKCDAQGAAANVEKLRNDFPEMLVVPTCAVGELALRKAALGGKIKYVPGAANFEICAEIEEKQAKALEAIGKIMRANGECGMGVQELIGKAVFEYLKLADVYPVEDEHKFCDNAGRVLPDAFLMKKGATVFDLAGKVHTDLQQHFIGAVNAKTKMRVGRDTLLLRGDVIRIIAGK